MPLRLSLSCPLMKTPVAYGDLTAFACQGDRERWPARAPLAHGSSSETSWPRDTGRPQMVIEVEQEAVRTSEGQYRPVMFACTVQRQHGAITVPALTFPVQMC
jgi:hypothetical protein